MSFGLQKSRASCRLRDLLFMEKSQGPPTPNGLRILEAQARMYPRKLKNRPRPNTAPEPQKEVEFPPLAEEKRPRQQLRGKVPVRRAHSDSVFIRVNDELDDVSDITGESDTRDRKRNDVNTGHAALTDVIRSQLTLPAYGDKRLLQSHTANANTVSPMKSSTPRMPLTPQPSPRRVSWSDSVVEAQHKDNNHNSRPKNNYHQALPSSVPSPPSPTPSEKQEKQLQRIMLSIPPHVMTKAMASSDSLSCHVGYSQKRLALIQRERQVGLGLSKGDRRFANLVDMLTK